MSTKLSEVKKEKKTWVKPKLIIYGDIEKLTTELPVPSLGTGQTSSTG